MESSEAIGSKRRIEDHLNIENTNCQSYNLSADASDGKELGKASQRNKKPVVIIKKYMLAYRLERSNNHIFNSANIPFIKSSHFNKRSDSHGRINLQL
jgi:hypothetical protein